MCSTNRLQKSFSINKINSISNSYANHQMFIEEERLTNTVRITSGLTCIQVDIGPGSLSIELLGTLMMSMTSNLISLATRLLCSLVENTQSLRTISFHSWMTQMKSSVPSGTWKDSNFKCKSSESLTSNSILILLQPDTNNTSQKVIC